MRPLWTCPDCGKHLVGVHMAHSCVRMTVDEFFATRPPSLRALYDAYAEFVAAIGPYEVDVAKTRISFLVRVRFTGVQRTTQDALIMHFWLKREIASSRFSKVEHYPPKNWIYTVRIGSPADLDDELRGWMTESYAVGTQQIT